MPYELELIGIKEESKDADAICFRWDNGDGTYTVGVFDGGVTAYGEELKSHMLRYYYKAEDKKKIDFVICSHSDLDHSSGLAVILENFEVEHLIMNRPWQHVEELFPKVNDGRITKESLGKRLKEKYPHIAKLEEIAEGKKIKIHDAFEGLKIYKKLTILSPSKELYLGLLVESEKTPLSESASLVNKAFAKIVESVKALLESWTEEKLREDVTTTAENEMSTVILGKMDEENFLLTGDVGLRGLRQAIDYAKNNNIDLSNEVTVYQVPHHGGRHNVSPSILNELVGNIIKEDAAPTKQALVSVSIKSDHPRQMVVNAFVRRGAKVFKTSGKTMRHSRNMPDREGWTSAENLKFNEHVEDWD